ncbi:glycosyltransferase family 2 protein [Patulibacter defluvii]|uniref:glycosyltransferase family 2 protein n=1 Tax=Patulibacter defluvii TaxID=3095358 RepID=UPI002A75C4EF|nr:glycosyltransferase family A protein [Patulibacter sp. DM4]
MRAGVVLPVRGFSPYLVQTLDAILGQTAPPAAVVVVDDGSSRPLGLHPEHEGRVQLVRTERSRGPGAARNAGVAALPPEVDAIAFCDHDDVWEPGHLAAHARAARRHPQAAILTGDTVIVGPDDRPTGERWHPLHPGPHRSFLVLPLVYERHPLCTSATVVRRDAFEAAGGFDEQLRQAEDLDLWLRLLEAGSDLVAVLGATVRYRRHPGGLTHDLVSLAESLLQVHRAHADQVEGSAARRAIAADLRGLAAGFARVGEPERARAALAEADALLPPTPGERLRRALLAVPLVRSRIGRGAPYGVA